MKNVVGAVGEVIDRLTLPAREKRQLQVDLLGLLAEHEKEMARSRSAAVVEEARGNWLQRSWRPLVMLVFALIVLVGTFTTLPILSDTSRFWDLLEIGLGSRGDRSGGGGVPAGSFQHRGVARGEELVRRAWRVEPLLDRDRAG